ncbi:MAG: Txe/YoeB family addiction module toxin [Treponema sp.]|nr:Txe/YoeB family addiction module toxin [Treponema sp.]
MYKTSLTRQAEKDARKLEQVGLKQKTIYLLRIIRNNPFQNPPPYEKLQGYEAVYSRRITIQHRLVYQVLPNERNEIDESGIPYKGKVKIIRMWTHYE